MTNCERLEVGYSHNRRPLRGNLYSRAQHQSTYRDSYSGCLIRSIHRTDILLLVFGGQGLSQRNSLVMISKNPIPEALTQRLTALFSSLDSFKRHLLVRYTSRLKKCVLICLFRPGSLEVQKGRIIEVVPEFAAIAKELLPLDEPMDLIPILKGGPHKGGARFYAKTTPGEAESQTTP